MTGPSISRISRISRILSIAAAVVAFAYLHAKLTYVAPYVGLWSFADHSSPAGDFFRTLYRDLGNFVPPCDWHRFFMARVGGVHDCT